jgi:hypothetical protein
MGGSRGPAPKPTALRRRKAILANESSTPKSRSHCRERPSAPITWMPWQRKSGDGFVRSFADRRETDRTTQSQFIELVARENKTAHVP